MKKIVYFTLLYMLITAFSCTKESYNENAFSKETCNLVNPSPTVSTEEIEIILHMREEEKLARDVYKYLYDTHGVKVFYNIMKSEQTHMDKMECLLEQYHIEDPVQEGYGTFTNQDLQNLYNQLTEQGKTSLLYALTVGATIEDLDILDLMEYSGYTTNEAILNIFDNLTCGSRNHMRAFVSNLQNIGATYAPQFISEELFQEIVTTTQERCGF